MRIAQRDLLDFTTNASYSHDLTWPETTGRRCRLLPTMPPGTMR